MQTLRIKLDERLNKKFPDFVQTGFQIKNTCKLEPDLLREFLAEIIMEQISLMRSEYKTVE